ncbi:MAG: glutamate-5-semialdehyde dehydrogenase [Saprospiraceae bacterium]|nr:glutamate-5-semialdehyde dehydrogenase [Saprospiraceae bacterium]
MILSNELKNQILHRVADCIRDRKAQILSANKEDVVRYDGGDQAMLDRLKVDDVKIDGMIQALETVASKPDPIGIVRDEFEHPNGMKVFNKTFPFGTIMIIYESRPDVTIEAAAIAFKTGNKILLKGGKEAINSNLALVGCWHEALSFYGLDPDWVSYLKLSRTETQQFLKDNHNSMDLIVPRGGEKLISFVREHATCPVLVSGRGNNFLYIDREADPSQAIKVVLNAKASKISACNALDKVLVDTNHPDFKNLVRDLVSNLKESNVEVLFGKGLSQNGDSFASEDDWKEEFLELKIVVGTVNSLSEAVEQINRFSGGHSASIITRNSEKASEFMDLVDCAAVYHNCSTRFTDGGEFGMGAELAISTEKLHHRGPLGLEQLVTNKYYVFGSGQVRE